MCYLACLGLFRYPGQHEPQHSNWSSCSNLHTLHMKPGSLFILEERVPIIQSTEEGLTSNISEVHSSEYLYQLLITKVSFITDFNHKANPILKSATLQTPCVTMSESAVRLLYHQHAMHHLLELISVTVGPVEVLHH